jgi:hypothetical protein
MTLAIDVYYFNEGFRRSTVLQHLGRKRTGLGAVLWGRCEIYVRATNLLSQEMQMYEDALWTIEGTPLFEGGIKFKSF